jgi:cytochrome c oxidase subunit II
MKTGMIAALILVLVALGTVLLHLVSPWWWTPIGSNWKYIDDTINLTFLITGVVFTAIVLFVAYCVFRFRHKEGRRAAYEPENSTLEWWLTVVTAVGVAALLIPGLFVWRQFVTVPEGAAEVEVVGLQWRWMYRLPGKDGKMGTSGSSHITSDNPLGINPADPNGKDDVVIETDDLHLQLGKSVKFLLRSIDVIHNFYVPEFRAKMDFMPGLVTYVWLTPTRTGTFDALCAELCGMGHYAMRGKVVVDAAADYEKWLTIQPTFAQLATQARMTAQAK